ncbi:hypothetical protein EON65_18765 [archaeon]|nr:MAG: hypothetical protein EON65_18765 [archaeon]
MIDSLPSLQWFELTLPHDESCLLTVEAVQYLVRSDKVRNTSPCLKENIFTLRVWLMPLINMI